MATQLEVNDFTATVMWQVCTLGNIVTNLISINGLPKNMFYAFKFRLINMYANVIIDYFSQYPYNINNFYTTDQIYLIIDQFNNLCNTNYSIIL
jgi:hypothetical protein